MVIWVTIAILSAQTNLAILLQPLSSTKHFHSDLPLTGCFFAGAFLIPYLIFLFTCGIPVFTLETALGQYTSEGGVTCWRKISPLFEGKTFVYSVLQITEYQTKIEIISPIYFSLQNQMSFSSVVIIYWVISSLTMFCTGLGYGTQVIVSLLNFYYIIVLAWAIFYFYHSFSWELPWSSCQNVWNLGENYKMIIKTAIPISLSSVDKYSVWHAG